PKETGLRIVKYETGTTIPLEGAMFEVIDPDGATVGTFATDRNGEINIPLTVVGNYTVMEREAPQHYLISKEPAQNVTVVYGKTAEVVFENDPYGNLRVEKVSSTGENLSGAVITIQHIESGQTYSAATNSAGCAMFPELKPGGYRIQETTAPAGYILNDTVYTTNVNPGETSVISIVNEEKPGLRITKYDSKNMEALTDITFEIFRDGVSIGKYKTNQLGEILLTDLEPGTYLVQEVASDSTHVVNSTPQQIELSGDDGILELVFLNDQKPGIHLVKLDATSLRPLPNAAFRIEQIGGTFSKEYVTDENGEIDLTALEPGAYTVTELEAPDGYLIDGAVRTIQINGNENAQFVFTNTRKPSLRVVKLDSATSEALPGATFRIAKIEDGSHYLDRITDANGEINISDLEPGVYSVVEMDAPDGYVKDTKEYHVELFPGKVSELVVSNDQKPDLEIVKTDATTGAPVSGVTFTVKKVDSSTLTTVTSDQDGRCWIENLDPGVYEVWEQSVPDGYLLNEDHQLITLVPNRIGTVQFQNYPKPTLTIHKIDLNGKALTGAIFEVRTKAGVKIGDFPVDENGSVTISNVHLAEGYYIITEIQAPEGYILDKTPHEVYLRPGRTTEISIENEKKPDLMIEKIDSVVGDGVQGAKFEIWVSKDKNEDGTYQKLNSNYYYTDANGHILLDNLDTGWYKIVEVEPPSGYMLKAPSEQTVYVDNDSSVTVTFENIPKSALIIRKVDADTGVGLANAWFRVRYLGGTSGSGGTIIGEYATSNNGNIILTGLDAGTYIVEEISAPDGYVIDTAAQTAYISGLDQDCITLTFTNSAYGSLLIKKVDSVTGEPLSNVQFFVTDSDGSVVGNANGYFTTDSAGTILINDIVPGTTLVVKETRTRSG
ncbi:MAG: SpaA isopeptide-forming pilin-related protein, partial [Faecousia sp.]